jgi:hypothetical protein
MKQGTFYQQGDVVIESISEIPKKGLKKLNHRILAEGEVIGHKHEVVEKELSNLYADEKGNLFLKANGELTITHTEHNPITIPAGTYRIRRVQEYDHFSEEAKNVQD